jgi:opacity protein-like surface antigen
MSVDLLPPPPPPPPSPPGLRPWRARSRLTLIGLLMLAVMAAAVTGVLVAGRSEPVTLATSSTGAQASSSPSPHAKPHRAFGPPGGPGIRGLGCAGPSAFFGGFFPAAAEPAATAAPPARGCGVGTVTNISGSTLTLRTLTGTLTVATESSTTYTKGGKSIKLNDIHVNDIVQVRPDRTHPSSSTSITASAITVVLPTIFGRVQSVSGNTITIVTATGQLAYVTTGGSTAYKMAGAAASSGDVKTGTFILAQGTLTNANHLSATNVQIEGAPRLPHPKAPPASPSPSSSGTAA